MPAGLSETDSAAASHFSLRSPVAIPRDDCFRRNLAVDHCIGEARSQALNGLFQGVQVSEVRHAAPRRQDRALSRTELHAQEFPGIEIQLREGFQDDVRDDVRSGLADFGICDIGDLPDSHLAGSLRVDQLRVVLREDHPLAHLQQIEFGALKDVALLSFRVGSTTRRLIDAAATGAEFALHHVVTVGLPLTLMNLVAVGVGAGITPVYPWRQEVYPNLVSRPPVRPGLSSEIGIIRLRDRELSPAAAGLLSLARERLRKGTPR